MFDRIYDFFFGDQIRKHVVLLSAFFLGQFLTIPLLAWLEPSQYVGLAVTISFISIWPLASLYKKNHAVPPKVTEHARQVEIRTSEQVDPKLVGLHLRKITTTLGDMASRTHGALPTGAAMRDIIIYFINNHTLSESFLQDYEKIIGHLPTDRSHQLPIPFSLSDLATARDLSMRLEYISYVNEKVIDELSFTLKESLLQDLEILKQARVPTEEAGKLIANMVSSFQQIQQIFHSEVQNLVTERPNTPS
jgi:hypothetical protein